MTRKHRWSAGHRSTKGQNKTEARFEAWLKARPEVVEFGYEPLRFVLANAANYTPDFVALLEDGTVEVWEIKGSMGWSMDTASQVRWKAAAETFVGGLFTFRTAHERRKKDGGGWNVKTYERRNPWPK